MSIATTASGRASSVRRLGIAALLLAAMLPPAAAHDYKVGSIAIGHPWSRATPPSAKTGAGYLTLSNTGSQADRLVGAASAIAPSIGVHEMSVVDDVMRMKPVDGGLEIPAGATVTLAPGGLHLMLVGLTRPLVEGETIPVTLTFEKAGTVAVEFNVDKLGATSPGAEKSEAGHDHGG